MAVCTTFICIVLDCLLTFQKTISAERRLRQLAPHAARQEWWDVPLERVEGSGLKASDDG